LESDEKVLERLQQQLKGESLENERVKQELEKTLTMGSFIDLKKLANKVNPQKQFISDGETRIKSLQSSASVTNMSAYLNKCQCNNPLQ